MYVLVYIVVVIVVGCSSFCFMTLDMLEVQSSCFSSMQSSHLESSQVSVLISDALSIKGYPSRIISTNEDTVSTDIS